MTTGRINQSAGRARHLRLSTCGGLRPSPSFASVRGRGSPNREPAQATTVRSSPLGMRRGVHLGEFLHGIVTIGIVTTGIFGLACVALPSCLATNIYNCVCVCLRLEHCEQYLYFPQGFGERAVLLQAPSLGYSTWARTHVGIPRRGDFMVTDGPVCRGSTVPVRSGLHLLTRRARSPSPSPRASSTFQPGQTRLRCTLGPGRLYVSS